MNWISLVSPAQLEQIAKESQESPVLIFKHSTTCSISHFALTRLERNWKDDKLKTYLLDLRAYRETSNQIASSFDVEHESPQVLIIDKGKAVYHRSHGDIEATSIEKFLATTN